VREVLPAICEPELPAAPAELRFELFMDEGGLLFDSSCWRELVPDDGVALLGRPFIAGELRAGPTPVRPGVKPELLNVRTRACEAPCAGAVRATTVRF